MFTEKVMAMAEGSQQAASGGSGSFGFLIPMVLVFIIFWFLLIRPQQKERQKHQELLESLKAGDKVITTGGLLGVIHSVTDDIVQVKLNDKSKISVLKSAIRGLQDENLQ